MFAEARRGYGEVTRFLAEHRDELMAGYSFAGGRLSCMGIEVRKDLFCDIDRERRVVRRADAEDNARRIAACIAPAVRAYLTGQESSSLPRRGFIPEPRVSAERGAKPS